MMKRFFTAVTMLLVSLAGAMAQSGHFNFDPNAYSDEHVIYVALTDNTGAVYGVEQFADPCYIGAFIDGECRGEAEVQLNKEDTGEPLDNPLFTLRVHGNGTADNGKTITFRVFKTSMVAEGQAEYIIPSTTASVAFQDHGTTGAPSEPQKIKFVPATNILLPTNILVPVNGTVNLTENLIAEPEDALIPYPLVWHFPDELVSIENNVLTAKQPTMGAEISLTAGTGILHLESNICMVEITNPATTFAWTDKQVTADATDGSKGSVTVPVGDKSILADLLSNGYSLLPEGATTTYTWTSSDETIIKQEDTGRWSVLAVGTAVLTGTPNDGGNTAPKLTVTVVQPVLDFTYGANEAVDTVLVAQVGDDVKAMLKALVKPYPATASNKEYNIDFKSEEYFEQQDDKVVAKKANSDGESPISLDEGIMSITITAADGFGATKDLKVVIIPTQPKAFAAKEATLFMVTPETLPAEISDKLYDNLAITPDTMKVSNWNVDMASSDEEVIQAYDEDDNGRPRFNLLKRGIATMTATITVLDNQNIMIVNDPTAASTLTIYTKVLETTFNVEIHDGLSEFTFDNVRATVGEAIEVTLTPQPANVDYEADKISVTVTPSVNMPEGWTFATVAAKEGDNTGLKWIITPKSVGNGIITVNYTKDDAPTQMGSNAINVDQQLTVKDGWQWISLYQGNITGKDTMQIVFGQKLGEIRSADAVVYNDAKYGYFGALSQLDTLKTYKLRMKDLGEATAYTILDSNDISSYFENNNNTEMTGGPKGALSIKTIKGWNWIGNPYQYYQQLSDIFGNTQFTEGDQIKGKTSFATYTNGAWAGELKYLTPGEGYLFYVANDGKIDFTREFDLKQQTAAPAAPAMRAQAQSPWTIDDSRFADNMSMIAHVGGLTDASRLTLYAFVGNECRGRGIAVGDRQFITIHGERGERITFRVYDEVTDKYYEIEGSRAFAVVSGTMEAPVSLYAGDVTAIDSITADGEGIANAPVYNLKGQRVANVQTKKGIYVQGGKKVVR